MAQIIMDMDHLENLVLVVMDYQTLIAVQGVAAVTLEEVAQHGYALAVVVLHIYQV